MASFVAPDPMCFDGNSFDFFAGGQYGPNATFNWQFGPFANVPISADEDPQDISFSSTGINNVTLVITDNGCESNLFQLPVLVHPQPVANFDASAYEVCEPALITFNNLSESTDPVKSIAWDFGNDRISALNNPTTLYSQDGFYTVRLLVTSIFGCTNEYVVEKMIQVNPTPEAAFNIDRDVVEIINPDVQVSDFSKGATQIMYSITALDTIYTHNAKVVFPDSGTYVITQIAENTFGCVDSFSRKVWVQIGYRLYVPTAFTPNNDGYNDYFKAYGEDVLDYKLEVFNRWGELLYLSHDMENGWDGTTRLSSSALPGGVYVYRINAIDKNGTRNTYEGTVNLVR
jgi:gliding motility-associated-like protein